MPKLMKMYDEFKELRDKFEILAFHDTKAKTFEEYDEKMKPVIEKRWKGKELPFPVLLDSTGKTIRNFGISAYPTLVLIDPEGKIVRRGGDKLLEEKLEGLRKKTGK